MHNFRKLKIWQKGMHIARETYKVTKDLPQGEKFGLISQMNRAAIAIPSNIAEGSGRNSQKEFHHFLRIAMGSAYELETQLILTHEIGITQERNVEELIKEVTQEQKMIQGMINK